MAYVIIRRGGPHKAKNCLVMGVAVTVLPWILPWALPLSLAQPAQP